MEDSLRRVTHEARGPTWQWYCGIGYGKAFRDARTEVDQAVDRLAHPEMDVKMSHDDASRIRSPIEVLKNAERILVDQSNWKREVSRCSYLFQLVCGVIRAVVSFFTFPSTQEIEGLRKSVADLGRRPMLAFEGFAEFYVGAWTVDVYAADNGMGTVTYSLVKTADRAVVMEMTVTVNERALVAQMSKPKKAPLMHDDVKNQACDLLYVIAQRLKILSVADSVTVRDDQNREMPKQKKSSNDFSSASQYQFREGLIPDLNEADGL